MFIYQGQKSFYLWNKINPEIDQEVLNLLFQNSNDKNWYYRLFSFWQNNCSKIFLINKAHFLMQIK